ncbi:MAG: hypothetical protein MJA30_28020, partial [Cytophagales bacterium]|nr:hypothetical protein [Cytophagales bacterium]
YVSNEGETVKPIYFDDLKIVQHTSASPEEMAIAESATMISLSVPTENNYLYQGIELQTDLDLDWYHFELRMYDPFISRFVISDPADQFNSPYLAMGNNPILATDPTGGFSPIYDSEGNYLGTDSEGFTGDVLIFNDPTKFVQGMDHDQALKIGMHFDDTKLSPQIEARIYTHIMSNMELPDGSLLDINDLVNSSISIQRPSGTFNKPELGKFHQWTTTPGGNGKINITAGTYSCETTVENIRASAGIHEYFGHGKQGKSDRYGNHHEAFAMTIESNLLGKYDRSIQEKYLETK